VAFVAVLSADGIVKVVSFADDPDYWAAIDDAPE